MVLCHPPEISVTPLEDVLLRMKAMGIIHVDTFPFPTSPPPASITAAIQLLRNLGAINISDDRLTSLGEQIARYPIGPRYAKMIVMAANTSDEKLLAHTLTLVASLSERSPFNDGNDRRGAFRHVDGDAMARLKAIGAFLFNCRPRKGKGSSDIQLRRESFCGEHGLNLGVVDKCLLLR